MLSPGKIQKIKRRRQLKILMLCHAYYPIFGGSEVLTTKLAEQLTQRGHSVEVITSDNADTMGVYNYGRPRLPRGVEYRRGVKINRLRMLKTPAIMGETLRLGMKRVGRKLPPGWDLLPSNPYMPALPLQLLRADHDVAFAIAFPNWTFVLPALMKKRGLFKPKLVLNPALHPESDRFTSWETLHYVLSSADAILTYTNFEANTILHHGNYKTLPQVIGVGVDYEHFVQADRTRGRAFLNLPETAKIILFTGRMTIEKGVLELAEALPLVQKHFPDTYLIFVGRKGKLLKSPRLINARNRSLPGTLLSLGEISEDIYPHVLAAADVLAMPSWSDSFGIVYLEAWSAGLPVIGAKSGAIPEVISEDQDGLLVPPRDCEVLARTLTALLSNPELRRTMGAAGREKVLQNYTWPRIADKVEAVFNEII